MPFEIVRNDIVNMRVDAIVNTANPRPVIGAGTDSAIHAKAGPGLLEARQKIGNIRTGSARITGAYGLDAKYVIHTVGPVWRGGLLAEEKQLRSCYDSALHLAMEYGCRSVAFPLISSGSYGFPKDKALQIAISAFSEFLTEHAMQIYLVVFDDRSFRLSEALLHNVTSYIDAHYVREKKREEYSAGFANRECARRIEEPWDYESREESILLPGCTAPMAMPSMASLPDFLEQEDAGFSETLLKLIDKTGKKDSAIYKKANLSKQHFSKIRNNPQYQPTKATALALALALELDLEAALDLIGRAGYTLSNSSKFDLIIRYFIEHGIYDVVQINMALYEFDQSLLGS